MGCLSSAVDTGLYDQSPEFYEQNSDFLLDTPDSRILLDTVDSGDKPDTLAAKHLALAFDREHGIGSWNQLDDAAQSSMVDSVVKSNEFPKTLPSVGEKVRIPREIFTQAVAKHGG